MRKGVECLFSHFVVLKVLKIRSFRRYAFVCAQSKFSGKYGTFALGKCKLHVVEL